MSTHHPRLSILAGPSISSLSPVKVNSDLPHDVTSEHFEGSIAVRIADYLGPPSSPGKPQPESHFLKNSTMSIVIHGRFLEQVTLDDVVWGNQWEQPLRDSLPYGTAAVIKFAHLVDPGLSLDVYADKPWAVSPLFITMDYLSIKSHPSSEPLPKFNPVVSEGVEELFESSSIGENKSFEEETRGFEGHPEKRKKWALDEGKRKKVVLNKDLVITSDFCNGYISFSTLSLKLPIGLSFPLEKYWDGQPVTFVCRKKGDVEKVYFLVQFQIVREWEEKGTVTDEGKGEKEKIAGGGDGDGKGEKKAEEKGEEIDELGID